MKFEVGKEVIAKSATYGWGNVKPGDKGIIATIRDGGTETILVDFPSQKRWSAHEKDLELVAPSARLQAGQKAVVIDACGHCFQLGDVVEIMKDDNGTFPFFCRRLSDGHHQWVKKEALTPYVEHDLAHNHQGVTSGPAIVACRMKGKTHELTCPVEVSLPHAVVLKAGQPYTMVGPSCNPMSLQVSVRFAPSHPSRAEIRKRLLHL